MEDYIAEANSNEDVIDNVIAGTEETNPFVDDNSALNEQGYESVAQTEVQSETSQVDWENETMMKTLKDS